MGRKVVICTLVFGLSLAATYAQQVEIPREKSVSQAAKTKSVATRPVVEVHPLKIALAEPRKLTIEEMRKAGAIAALKVKEEDHDIETDSNESAPPKKQIAGNAVRAVDRPASTETTAGRQSREEPPAQSISFSGQMAFTKLADGFDLPVGKPDARGYYKARGFKAHGHLGEDWDGVGGGDTDLGDPVFAIGDGVVVFARDCHQGWGNVISELHQSRRDG